MLQVQDLCKSYGQRRVLDHLNLNLNPGDIYGLLGPNGAGKTTTISILCSLIQPDCGEVLICGEPLDDETKPLIGLAPQENLIYASLTCAENLDFFARLYGLPKVKRRERVQYCLESVGLGDRTHCIAEQLSGGMQRRLSMAIALVHQPKLVILDEPTTGLDRETRSEIWRLIRQLQQEGITILITTHLLDEAERLCNRVGIVKQGTLLAEGSIQDLRQHVPAAEIVLVKTPEEKQAIERGKELGFYHRHYGEDLAFWLPNFLDLKEVMQCFANIPLDSISRHPVGLEHIYDEILRSV
jgi:ABC-2 type transport system ATP-binding protein